jgi:hypothetical protein
MPPRRLGELLAPYNETYVYTFGDKNIYKRVRDLGEDWVSPPLAGPTEVTTDGKDWTQIFACEDGSVIAIVDKKLQLWNGKVWAKNEKGGDFVRIAKTPAVEWWHMRALEKLVEDIQDVKA